MGFVWPYSTPSRFAHYLMAEFTLIPRLIAHRLADRVGRGRPAHGPQLALAALGCAPPPEPEPALEPELEIAS